MSLVRRFRFEIARRLNRRRSPRDYRWARRAKRGRTCVLLRDASGREREVSLRLNTSDFDVFLQIFDQNQYEIGAMRRGGDVQACYESIIAAGDTPLIVDAGANVGLGALYFRDRYPLAKILAIEPEDGNFAELCTRADPLTVPIKAGLANFDGYVEVCDPGLGEWGFRTRRADHGVPAITLATLLATHPGEPFILKVDIEGFEADLFDDPALLDRFALIYFEPHDWMLPGQGSAASFLRAIAGLDRDFLISGENIVSIANR